MEIFDFVGTQLQSNDFFKGGFLLAVLGYLAVVGRKLPVLLWSFIKRRLIVECDVQQLDDAFKAVEHWLAHHPYGKTVKRFTASQRGDDILLSPAPGNHLLWYKGHLVRVNRSREKSKAEDFLAGFYESFTMQTWGSNRKTLESLVTEAVNGYKKELHGMTKIHSMSKYDGWNESARVTQRPINSVILDDGIKDQIVTDLQQFFDTKDWYIKMGIPYKRGYLFYGPPGTGKTSFSMALAGHFDMDLAVMSLTSDTLDDTKLAGYMAYAPHKSILLLEDLDCLHQGRESKKGVTLSGLLNVLDGALSKEGQIIIMTTNHPEKLDSALIRPGRADVHVLFDKMSEQQIESIFNNFFPDADDKLANEFANKIGDRKESPANIQRFLMLHRNSPEKAINNTHLIGSDLFYKEVK